MFTNLVKVSVVLLAVFLQLEGRPSDTNSQASNLPPDSIQMNEFEPKLEFENLEKKNYVPVKVIYEKFQKSLNHEKDNANNSKKRKTEDRNLSHLLSLIKNKYWKEISGIDEKYLTHESEPNAPKLTIELNGPTKVSQMKEKPYPAPVEHVNYSPIIAPPEIHTGNYMNPLPPVRLLPYPPVYVLRQWNWPFANYFPIVINDPYQEALNYFQNVFQYGPSADVCKGMRLKKDDLKEERIKRDAEESSYEGQRRYDEEYTGEEEEEEEGYRKLQFPIRKTQTAEQEESNNPKNTDSGLQIRRLVVRRGGVAIAGAGGIATAGSGGTAIVGLGGTAFTTPASSGGIAMVGPGGKVISVPDIANALYGRKLNKEDASVTTADKYGALVILADNGKILSIKDDPSKFITSGPIIYYSPVYNQSLKN